MNVRTLGISALIKMFDLYSFFISFPFFLAAFRFSTFISFRLCFRSVFFFRGQGGWREIFSVGYFECGFAMGSTESCVKL